MRSLPVEEARPVVAGYNHDVAYADRLYHVQTEQIRADGGDGIRIATDVFEQGRVVGRYCRPFGAGAAGEAPRQLLAERLRQQHKEALRCVLSGRLGHLAADLDETLSPSGPQRSGRGAARRVRKRPIEPPTPMDLDLRSGLIRFARAVGEEAPAPGEATLRRLRSIVTVCALLMVHPARHRIRQGALAEMLMRRAEAIAYVRDRLSGEPTFSDPYGRELWQSFRELATGFAAANQRESFRRHDASAFRRILDRWRGRDRERIRDDPETLTLLRRCKPRNRSIELALDDLRFLTGEELRPLVERALAELESESS
ncbi:MAG: hypothetical protein MI919_08495 [Holophagales bacterium]|nr:hypothetical protein [Holophagales bacterium]